MPTRTSYLDFDGFENCESPKFSWNPFAELFASHGSKKNKNNTSKIHTTMVNTTTKSFLKRNSHDIDVYSIQRVVSNRYSCCCKRLQKWIFKNNIMAAIKQIPSKILGHPVFNPWYGRRKIVALYACIQVISFSIHACC
jgi:anaerobic ribonucleoside-triphosphate reductase